MILSSFLAALGQVSDRRFVGVMATGVALSLALLGAVYAAFVRLAAAVLPETVNLPWIGQINWLSDLVGWGSLAVMIGLSVFLMIPVAALFSGLFLERVADAVEDRHYPDLAPARPQGLLNGLIGSVNFCGVLVIVNTLALIGYLFAGPLAPALFWGLNGYLLGREYFQTVAARRLDRSAAKALRKANAGTIWLAGCLMAAPLSLPFVNLVIPVLGVATFTHIFHRLIGARHKAQVSV